MQSWWMTETAGLAGKNTTPSGKPVSELLARNATVSAGRKGMRKVDCITMEQGIMRPGFAGL